MVGVQVARCRTLLAEPGPIHVAVLPTLVLGSVRARFAHFHGCESAALTRPCGPCTRMLQGDNPQRRHEGPQNLDLFLGTASPRVIVSARRHGVHLGMKVRFTPRHACTCSPLTNPLRSSCCSTEPRGRLAPSRPSRTTSPQALRRAAARFSTTQSSSRGCRCCCRSLPGGVQLQGGGRGGCCGAAARRLAPGGSGAPPARLRRLWRRRAARRLPLPMPRGLRKILRATGRFFSRCVYVCVCVMRVSDARNSPLHEGMRSVAGRDVSAHQSVPYE